MQKRWFVIGGVVAAVVVALVVLLGGGGGSKATSSGKPGATDAGVRRPGGGGAVDDVGAAIDGTVLDERGGAISGAVVRAAPSSRLGGGEDAEAPTTQTRPDGSFTLAVTPGRWTVTAGAAGRVPADAAVEVSSGQRARVELRLAPGGAPLTGTVVDVTGGPVAGAIVVLAPEQGVLAADQRRAVAVTADADGRFSVGVVPGRWRATTTHPEYVRDQRAIDVGPGGATLDIGLVPGGVIEGVVRDRGTGAVVPSARVGYRREVVASGPMGEGAATTRERGTVTAGADGAFRIAGLGTGRILLDAEATADDRASDEPTEVLLGIAETATDVEVFVAGALSIRGRVAYEDGTPAAGASVTVEQRGDARGVTCDADGTFHVGGLRPGRYLASAEAEDATPSKPVPVELEATPVTDVELTVARGAFVVGRVEPAGLAEITVIRPDDDVMIGPGLMRLQLGGPTARTTADGTFRIGPFAPGTIALGARAPDGRRGQVSVDVIAQGNDGVVIALEAKGRIAGRVVSGGGQPVPGAVVNLRRVAQGASRTTIVNGVDVGADRAPVDLDGTFAVSGLDAGTWKLTVLDARGAPMAFDGGKDEPVEVALKDGEQKDGVELVVEVEDGVIRGVVLGPDGAPVEDAWVTVRPEVTSLPGVGPIQRRGGPPPGPPPEGEDGEGVSMMITMIDDSGPQAGEIPPVLTGADGRFEITGLRRGTYQVSAEGKKGAARGRVGEIATGSDCTVRLATLSALDGVVTIAGAPVTDYVVSVDGPIRKERQVHADDGTFSMRGLDPGDYAVVARTPAGVGEAKVTIVAGQASRVAIAIQADGTVTGKLVDAAGAPLADHMVIVGPRMAEGEMRIELGGEPPMTAADGTFTASAPAGAKTMFLLGPKGPVARVDVDLTAGARTDAGTITSGTGFGPRP